MSRKRQIRSPEEKFKIVMADIQGDFGSIAELCNHYGITQTDYYRWRDILARGGDWIEALEQAISAEFPQGIRDMPPDHAPPELVSDHGSQPTFAAFRGACDTPGISQIFTSYGNPKGNAGTERMMRTTKEYLIYPNDFQTFNEIETEMKKWMKRYNEEFPHSALGYDTPLEYENWFYAATRKNPPYLTS